MSGASVSLIEDLPEQTEKVVRISGTPEQSERAQSLLQGFILSSKPLSLPSRMHIFIELLFLPACMFPFLFYVLFTVKCHALVNLLHDLFLAM